jgi:hypothetical protein
VCDDFPFALGRSGIHSADARPAFSHALSPIVGRLQALHIPRAIGAALLLLMLFSGVGATVELLQDDATALMSRCPIPRKSFVKCCDRNTGRPVRSTTCRKPPNRSRRPQPTVPNDVGSVTRVQVDQPQFNIKEFLWTNP